MTGGTHLTDERDCAQCFELAALAGRLSQSNVELRERVIELRKRISELQEAAAPAAFEGLLDSVREQRQRASRWWLW